VNVSTCCEEGGFTALLDFDMEGIDIQECGACLLDFSAWGDLKVGAEGRTLILTSSFPLCSAQVSRRISIPVPHTGTTMYVDKFQPAY
jgi:hypothetical protein